MVLDGAMGTMVQSYGLDEAAFRGARFRDHHSDLKGDNDILCLTQPAIVAEIHRRFLEAGADILTTNTFNATPISQHEYGLVAPRLRDLPRGGAHRAHRGGCLYRARPVPAALRGRVAPAHQPHAVDIARGQRPRLSQRDLR